MELPFLVVHGAIVWKLLLVGLVAVTFASIWALRSLAARRVARGEVAVRASRVTAPREGEVTISGQLHGGSLWMLERDGRRSFHTSDGKPDGVWLTCVDTRVELPESIVIARGDVERWTLRAPKRPELVTDAIRGATGPYLLRGIRDGATVTVTGSLERKPGGDSGYREADAIWALSGDATIASEKPRAVSRPLSVVATAALVGALALGWYAVLVKIGAAAAEDAEKLDDDYLAFTPERLADSRALQIAFAMPQSRDDAMETLGSLVDERRERSDRGLAFAELVDELDGTQCNAWRHSKDLRWEQALAIRRRCDPEGTLHTLQLLGEYEQANAHPALKPDDMAIVTAVAVGQWSHAAGLATALAATQANETPNEWSKADRIAKRARRTKCLARLFLHHAGSPITEAAPEDDRFCATIEALRLPREDQLAALEAIELGHEDTGLSLLHRDHLRPIAGGPPHVGSWGRDPIIDVVSVGFRIPWLSRFDLVESDQTRLDRYALQLLVDPIAASKTDVPSGSRDMYQLSNRIAVALRLGRPLPEPESNDSKGTSYIHPAIADMVDLRRGKPHRRPILSIYPKTCEPRLLAAIASAQQGTGGPLAATLRECSVSGDDLYDILFGVLPFVKTDRAALAETVRYHLQDIALTHDFPFHLLLHAARNRDLLRLVGDEAGVATWQRIVDRHAKPFTDRDRAIAIHLVHERY